MKKTKRLVSFVTATAFLLSSIAPAFAAPVDDAFSRLNALSVATGYPDGTIGADKSITRAEFAAIAVRMMGMEAAVSAAKGATKFSDVAASHWASGYINLAVGNGIIKGYPNGKFAPEANVTYAEASAMLIRLLGYEPQTTGTWPTNYIGKAAQLGLLDGVNATDFNTAATRGNVFLAADNSLDVKLLKVTKDGYEEDTVSLMQKRLGVTKKAEGVVTVTPNYGEKGKVTIDPTPNDTSNTDDFTVTTIDSLDGNQYWGEKVEVWVKDDKAFFFNRKNASDVIKDKVVAADTDGTKVYFDAKDRDYLFSDKLVVRQNFNNALNPASAPVTSMAAIDNLADGTPVKAVLDSAGKVAYVEVFTYSKALVSEVKATDEKIVIKEGSPSSLELKNDTYTIVKNGKVVGVSDVKAGDVLDVAKNSGDSKFYIYATDKTVTGKVESYTNDGSNFVVTIAGTGYKTTSLKVSTNNGDSYSAAIADVVGKTVTARLNKDGRIAFMASNEAAESNFFPVVVKSIVADGTIDKNVFIKIAKVDGTNTSYQVTKDTKIDGVKVDNSTNGLKAGTPVIKQDGGSVSISTTNNNIVKATLTTDGKVKEFKTYASGERLDYTNAVSVSKTNDTINGYKANSDTKLAYVNTDGDYKAMTWADFEALVSNDQINKDMTLIIDKGIVKFVFITEASAVLSDWKYGVVTAIGYDSVLDGNFTQVTVNGVATKFKGTDAAAVEKALIQFKVSDNELNTVTAATYATDVAGSGTYRYTVLDYNTTDKLLKIRPAADTDDTNAKWVVFDKDALVFKGKDKKEISDAKDKVVRLYDVMNDKKEGTKTDGAYDFIIIEE